MPVVFRFFKKDNLGKFFLPFFNSTSDDGLFSPVKRGSDIVDIVFRKPGKT
jgi:hypothetical protein